MYIYIYIYTHVYIHPTIISNKIVNFIKKETLGVHPSGEGFPENFGGVLKL